MLKRTDIVDGPNSVFKDYGLIYTCLCGWIDLAQARPITIRNLWSKLVGEAGIRSLKHPGFKVQYSQPPSRHTKGATKNYYVRSGLSSAERESVTLAIYMEVAYGFQTVQSEFPYGWTADSGFSAENLVSNIIGFYRAVRPGRDYISMCRPVSKEDALEVWDTQNKVGKKRSRFFGTYIYPSIACGIGSGPMSAPLPNFLTGITPANKGPYFHRWNDREEGIS
ncbi:MAG: hypothetical protein WBA23_17400 [Tunicatimonas sp.]|uniref:hypothetical protein n=1 Tax=Tunicatimonas sp. TaxID=1940096 RepID=UPI003C74B1C9